MTGMAAPPRRLLHFACQNCQVIELRLTGDVTEATGR
jgi:hypothetical protein